MKVWLIRTYNGPSRIVNDIVSNLALKPTPSSSSKKEKYTYYSAITGAIQHLERLAWVNYIDKIELETCLLSRSTLSSLTRLIPTIEHDVWVREMTKLGLDFRNPVGLNEFDCFKSVCIMERNTAEIGRTSEPFFLIHLFFKIIKYSKSLKFDSHSVVGRFDTFFKNCFTTLLH